LCFAEDWVPYVMGALKSLTRRETYQGSEADISTSVLGGMKLIASLQRPCSASIEGVPFACPGDLSESSGPYGTWAIGCVGAYVATQGYGPSLGMCGSAWYYGADLLIDLGAAYPISRITVVYDLIKGVAAEGSCDLLFVYDNDHHAFIGSPLTYDDLVTAGGQVVRRGPSSGDVRNLRIFLASDGCEPGIFVPTGNMRITRVDIEGTFTEGTTPPC